MLKRKADTQIIRTECGENLDDLCRWIRGRRGPASALVDGEGKAQRELVMPVIGELVILKELALHLRATMSQLCSMQTNHSRII